MLSFTPLALIDAAAFIPGVIRIGTMRVSVFGFFAAAGLVAAIWLSQYTARLAAIPAQKLWDAGVFLVFAAFVLSRLLLIAQDFQGFLHYPLIMLSLPSLTYGGMALTAIATLIYIRATHLPILPTLDAWAPCAALLAAVLALAHFIEGTDAGMPTTLPWGITTPGDSILGRVHPVQIYAMIIALVLLAYLLYVLARPHIPGHIAARAFIVGGVSVFLLDMLSQPLDTQGSALLDPGQYIALTSTLLGLALFQTPKPAPQELS
jgi:phosphatidylglycerol:prolipoprotein diacylglycerol transferase